MVLVFAQEDLRLGAELLEVPAGGETGQINPCLGAHLVLEIGEDDPTLLLIDQLGQITHPTPH